MCRPLQIFESKYNTFKLKTSLTSPNIYHSNQHIGTGLLTGTLNAFETDEDGNTSFNPSKFVTGFIGGSLASKIGLDTIKRLSKYPRAREIFNKMHAENDIIPFLKQGKGIKVKNENIMKLSTHGQNNLKDLRSHLKFALNDILNKDIINKNDGRVARISTTGLHKISSQKALNKSLNNGFTQDEHYKAGELIKNLYENSFYLKSEKANNNSVDIKAVHRYISPLQINGKDAIALITLKENLQSGNRIYSLELDGLSPRP